MQEARGKGIYSHSGWRSIVVPFITYFYDILYHMYSRPCVQYLQSVRA